MSRRGCPRSAEARAKIGAANLGNSTKTRADDDALLTALWLRDRWGWGPKKIAGYLGKTTGAITEAMKRVDAATEPHSEGKAA